MTNDAPSNKPCECDGTGWEDIGAGHHIPCAICRVVVPKDEHDRLMDERDATFERGRLAGIEEAAKAVESDEMKRSQWLPKYKEESQRVPAPIRAPAPAAKEPRGRGG